MGWSVEALIDSHAVLSTIYFWIACDDSAHDRSWRLQINFTQYIRSGLGWGVCGKLPFWIAGGEEVGQTLFLMG